MTKPRPVQHKPYCDTCNGIAEYKHNTKSDINSPVCQPVSVADHAQSNVGSDLFAIDNNAKSEPDFVADFKHSFSKPNQGPNHHQSNIRPYCDTCNDIADYKQDIEPDIYSPVCQPVSVGEHTRSNVGSVRFAIDIDAARSPAAVQQTQ